jgi:hypothetical protein
LIVSRIPLPAYVIDFVVTDTDIWVLETNPFDPSTGAGLFSWDADSKLLHGQAPFEFRVNTASVVEGIAKSLSKPWQAIVFPAPNQFHR